MYPVLAWRWEFINVPCFGLVNAALHCRSRKSLASYAVIWRLGSATVFSFLARPPLLLHTANSVDHTHASEYPCRAGHPFLLRKRYGNHF
jgi:hypothetical protein